MPHPHTDTLTDAERQGRQGLNPRHFDLLRIAKLRGLKIRKIGDTTYAVTSYSRAGLEWVISGGVCTCPAKGFCTHLAMAADHFFLYEGLASEYVFYRGADADDRLALRLRIRSGETTRNDRTYMRYCLKFYERKRQAAKLDTSIRTVETTRRGLKTRREFVGGIQI